MHKKLVLFLAVAYTLTLITVSLVTLKKIPDLGSPFDDKIYHAFAYVVLAVLWFTALWPIISKKKQLLIFGSLIIFGVCLEFVQQPINPNRTFEIIDALSNCLGIIVGTLLMLIVFRFTLNKNKPIQ